MLRPPSNFSIDFFGCLAYSICMNSDFSYQFFNTSVLAWEAMYQAILAAKKSIFWEVYTLVDDEAGKRFIELLAEKAAVGIDVKIIVDAFGSYDLSKSALFKLQTAGAKIVYFNRLRPGINIVDWVRRMWYRTHRKILIIDEERAFVGGVNVEQPAADWYDLHLLITGSAVIRPLLYGFAKSYIHCGGNAKEVEHLLHPDFAEGLNSIRNRINFLMHAPFYAKISPFKKFYYQSLESAQNTFNVVTPYYVPDLHFLDLVSRAKKRGVEVNIILPWETDVNLMRHMANAFYGISSKAGVSFYMLKKMNHAKAVSYDDKLGIVGSANFTPRSFFINQEASAAFSDPKMVGDLNKIIGDWKKEAVPLSEVGLSKKKWSARFKDWWLNKFKDYV